MTAHLKAMFFASAAALALSAASLPAFADDGDATATPYDQTQDTKITNNTNAIGVNAGNITANTNAIGDNKKAIEANTDALKGKADASALSTKADADSVYSKTDADSKISDAVSQAESKQLGVDQDQNTKIQQNTTDIGTNKSNISAAQKAADDAAQAAKTNTQNITQNTTDIGANKTAITAAQKAAEDANTAAGKAQGDATGALTGKAQDDTARSSAAANAARIEAANQSISDTGAAAQAGAAQALKSANDYTDSRVNQLDGKMRKLRARVDNGVAGATAIGTLSFDTLKPNSVSGGLAVAKDKMAGAVGYQRNFNANWRARATIAVSDNYVQSGASVGYSW